MDIKMNTRKVTYNTIDYAEWERVVAEIYSAKGWSFVADHEGNNDSNYSFDVNGKMDDWDEGHLKEFKKDCNKGGWVTQVLLDDLCRNGIINPGVYLIEVCW